MTDESWGSILRKAEIEHNERLARSASRAEKPDRKKRRRRQRASAAKPRAGKSVIHIKGTGVFHWNTTTGEWQWNRLYEILDRINKKPA